MDLADQIASANDKKVALGDELYDIDEYGLAMNWEDLEYIAARIIWRNLSEYSVGRADLLHTRSHKRELWLGHERLKQDKKTLYRLAATRQLIQEWMVPQVYEIIREHAKWLDSSKFVVDDWHYWDKETGELKVIEGTMPTITPMRRAE